MNARDVVKKLDPYVPGRSEDEIANEFGVNKEDIIKDEIIKIVSNHTLEEMKNDQAGVQDEILERLRKLFESDFIVSVAFPTYNYE